MTAPAPGAVVRQPQDDSDDDGECNSGNLVVVGADSSAALGSLWIAWAWKHIRRSTPTFPPVPINRNQPEGQDIACAVWLSYSPLIAVEKAKITLHPDSWLAAPVREKVPMFFLYGEQDTKAKTYALHLYDGVLHARKDKKLKLTVKIPIKDTKLSGRELLGKPSLNAEELILTYVSKVLEDRGSNQWTKRDVDRTLLVRVPIEGIH